MPFDVIERILGMLSFRDLPSLCVSKDTLIYFGEGSVLVGLDGIIHIKILCAAKGSFDLSEDEIKALCKQFIASPKRSGGCMMC